MSGFIGAEFSPSPSPPPAARAKADAARPPDATRTAGGNRPEIVLQDRCCVREDPQPSSSCQFCVHHGRKVKTVTLQGDSKHTRSSHMHVWLQLCVEAKALDFATLARL